MPLVMRKAWGRALVLTRALALRSKLMPRPPLPPKLPLMPQTLFLAQPPWPLMPSRPLPTRKPFLTRPFLVTACRRERRLMRWRWTMVENCSGRLARACSVPMVLRKMPLVMSKGWARAWLFRSSTARVRERTLKRRRWPVLQTLTRCLKVRPWR